MASSNDSSRTDALCFLSLLLATAFFSTALSQAPSSSTSRPTVTSCQPQLLYLVPCAPFVQGTVQSPAGTCCNNLDRIYRQQPNCICLLLSSSDFNSLPINSTLALQLPQLCHLQGDAALCSGVPVPPITPSERAPNSPAAQVLLGGKNESSIAASPASQVAPRPSIISSGHSLNKGIILAMGIINSASIGIVMIALLTAGPYF
ncbi:protein YLS3 [Punica granatum]|uniref:Protein YLS3 n=2 Tax=Punica granatum TaxID=22663 RepID=A0A6P8EIF8_PUNGR|nr:protein YLS3 [Punica granatum]PKI43868.1 hypothetical protein CRG98_035702 [Punica granatum]